MTKWEQALKRGGGWKSSPYKTVCSVHFEEHMFDRTGQTYRLRKTTVPSIFPAFPSYFKRVNYHQIDKVWYIIVLYTIAYLSLYIH